MVDDDRDIDIETDGDDIDLDGGIRTVSDLLHHKKLPPFVTRVFSPTCFLKGCNSSCSLNIGCWSIFIIVCFHCCVSATLGCMSHGSK